MTKNTINVLKVNVETERAYMERHVPSYVYQPGFEFPDQDARAQQVEKARDLLKKYPSTDHDGATMRETGKRMLFALAQIRIAELEATEAASKRLKARSASAFVRPAWDAIYKARESSYFTVTGRQLRPWSFAQKNPGFTKARTDRQFQAFMLNVGIKSGKVTPALRKSAKAASVLAPPGKT